MLRDHLFASLSDKEITATLLSFAREDHTFENLCPFIEEDFERLLSVPEDEELTLDEKQGLCGLAFEMIILAAECPKIAILIWLMFCCYHAPDDWVHQTVNLHGVQENIYSYCLHSEDKRLLEIFNEASFCFATYYQSDLFLEATLIYIATCEKLGKIPEYKTIIEIQTADQSRKEMTSLFEYIGIVRDTISESFLDNRIFENSVVKKNDVQAEFESFLNMLRDSTNRIK